jgi:hypothetical protein
VEHEKVLNCLNEVPELAVPYARQTTCILDLTDPKLLARLTYGASASVSQTETLSSVYQLVCIGNDFCAYLANLTLCSSVVTDSIVNISLPGIAQPATDNSDVGQPLVEHLSVRFWYVLMCIVRLDLITPV